MKKKVFLNRFLDKLGLTVVRKSELDEMKAQIKGFVGLCSLKIDGDPAFLEGPVSPACIVFSKDRALQLHALLSSLFELARNISAVHIIYKASDNRHKKAYQEVFHLFEGKLATVSEDNPFRYSLLNVLATLGTPKVMFLVDDIVVIRPFDMMDIGRFPCDRFVPSLRLGKQLSYSFWHETSQPLPPFMDTLPGDRDKACWRWSEGQMEWGFPMSIDGNIFSTLEMRVLLENSDFSAPNSLEGALKGFAPAYIRRCGVCYEKSRIVNIPCNRVQSEYDYRHGNVHQDFLLQKSEKGFQINYAKFNAMINRSVHEDAPLEFILREERFGRR